MACSAHAVDLPTLDDAAVAAGQSAPAIRAEWRLLSAAHAKHPSPRSFHTLSAVRIHHTCNHSAPDADNRPGEFLVLVGGRDAAAVMADPYLFHVPTQRWAPLHIAPWQTTDAQVPPRDTAPVMWLRRAYHSAVVRRHETIGGDAKNDEVWLFGGKTSLDEAPTSFDPALVRLRFTTVDSLARPLAPCSGSSSAEFGIVALVDNVIDAGSIGPRAYHSAVLMPRNPKQMVVYGGFNGNHFFDVLSLFDFDALRWTHLVPTPEISAARRRHDSKHDEVASTSFASPTSANPTAPARAKGPATEDPNRRSGSARRDDADACASPTNAGSATRCVHCGATFKNCIHNSSLWFLQNAGLLYSAALLKQPSMPPRDAATIVCGLMGEEILIVGGEVAQTFFNSVLALDVHKATSADTAPEVTWRPVFAGDESATHARINAETVTSSPSKPATGSPAPRGYHCSWPVGGRCVAVFGGFALENTRRGKIFDDLRVFDLHTRSWREITQCAAVDGCQVPAGRASAAVAIVSNQLSELRLRDLTKPQPETYLAMPNSAASTVYVFGGDNGGEYFGDLWRCEIRDESITRELHFSLRTACERFLH